MATHPLFIEVPAESDLDRQFRDSLLLRDIIRLLELVGRIDSDLRLKIESTELRSGIENKTYILGEVLRRQCDMPFNLDGFWGLIEDEVLKFLANQAWHITKNVSENL